MNHLPCSFLQPPAFSTSGHNVFHRTLFPKFYILPLVWETNFRNEKRSKFHEVLVHIYIRMIWNISKHFVLTFPPGKYSLNSGVMLRFNTIRTDFSPNHSGIRIAHTSKFTYILGDHQLDLLIKGNKTAVILPFILRQAILFFAFYVHRQLSICPYYADLCYILVHGTYQTYGGYSNIKDCVLQQKLDKDNISVQIIKNNLSWYCFKNVSSTVGRFGDRIPVGRDFPPGQTGPEAHPASCTMGTGCFPEVKYSPVCCWPLTTF